MGSHFFANYFVNVYFELYYFKTILFHDYVNFKYIDKTWVLLCAFSILNYLFKQMLYCSICANNNYYFVLSKF